MKENNNSISPTNSAGLVRVNSSISIVDKILKEHNFKLHNHKNLLTDNWDNQFPYEWREILELHIILTKLDIQIDTQCSIYHQYKSLFHVEYRLHNKTDYNHLKSLKILNLRLIKEIDNLTPIHFFEKLTVLNFWCESKNIIGIENIGKLTTLRKLFIYAPNLYKIDFLNANTELKYLSLLIGKISDFSPFAELLLLEHLIFSTNKLSSSNPVFKLTNLKGLDIFNCNDVENIELFSQLSHLEDLALLHLNINNINFLKKLRLKSLRIRDGGLKKEDVSWLRKNVQDLLLL